MQIFPEYIGQTRVRRSETEVLCGIDKVLNICNELKVQYDLLSFFSNFQMRRSLQMRLQNTLNRQFHYKPSLTIVCTDI